MCIRDSRPGLGRRGGGAYPALGGTRAAFATEKLQPPGLRLPARRAGCRIAGGEPGSCRLWTATRSGGPHQRPVLPACAGSACRSGRQRRRRDLLRSGSCGKCCKLCQRGEPCGCRGSGGVRGGLLGAGGCSGILVRRQRQPGTRGGRAAFSSRPHAGGALRGFRSGEWPDMGRSISSGHGRCGRLRSTHAPHGRAVWHPHGAPGR